MSRFGFTTGRALLGGLAASDRRFQQSQMEFHRRTLEAEAKSIQDTADWTVTEQKRLVDLQNEFSKSLEDAIRLSEEARDDFEKFTREEAEKQTKRLDEIAGDTKALASNSAKQVEEVNRRLDVVLGLSINGTAGGPVGRTTASGAYVNGTVACTGEVKLWHRHITTNAAGVLELRIPFGWLICDGTSFSQQQFPELAVILGGTYLGSKPPGYWLPAKADLTGDSVILNNTALDYLIRT